MDDLSGQRAQAAGLVGACRSLDAPAVEHGGHGDLRKNLRGAALVVGLRMRDDEEVEPARALAAHQGRDVVAGRAGVDEHGAAAGLDERRVALADVEEGDAQRRRRSCPVMRRRDGGEQRGDDERYGRRAAHARHAGPGREQRGGARGRGDDDAEWEARVRAGHLRIARHCEAGSGPGVQLRNDPGIRVAHWLS